MSFISELKRRNVFRVAVAYGVVAWLLLQVSDVLVDALDLPGAWTKTLIALLAIGLIPVLVFSWVYEMTPEGLKRESEVPKDASVTAHTAKKLDLAVIVLLVLAIGLFAADRLWMREPATAAPRVATQPTDAAAPTTADAGIPVVAVLPLNALSSDQEGTFLASGLHDDLLTRLAKLQAFKVISRTSVMKYLDTTLDIRQIGRELGAGFIVEGGLQSHGGRVSINAQLIDAGTDQHLWAETFNRELTASNLFDVQAEIAAAISTALHATLSPSDQATLDTTPTTNLAAYQAYLRGLETAGQLSQDAIYSLIEAQSEAVALDPDFVEAWARLSAGYSRRYWEEGGEDALAPDPAVLEQAGQALARAEALDAGHVDTLLAGAIYRYYGFRDYAGALIKLGQAEATAPHEPRVISLRGYLLRRLGRLDEAADALLRALEVNFSAGDTREAMLTLQLAGRCEEAVQVKQRGLQNFPGEVGITLGAASIALTCQDDEAGSRALLDQARLTTLEEYSTAEVLLVHLHDYAAAIERAQEVLEAIGPDGDRAAGLVLNSELAWLYRMAGQPALSEEALAKASAAVEGLPRNSAILVQEALVEALRGNRSAAVGLLGQAKTLQPDDAFNQPWSDYEIARVLAIAGANEEALAQLENLDRVARHEERFRLTADPAFDALRDEPQFVAALQP